MVGVGQQYARARCFEGIDRLAFDRGLGADRHEHGRLNFTVQGSEFCRPGFGVGGGFFESEVQTGHGWVGPEIGLALQ